MQMNLIKSISLRCSIAGLLILGSATHGLCGYLGIDYAEKQGVIVLTEVTQNSPAFESGLRVGDSVVGFNGIEIKNPDQVIRTIRQLPTGAVCDFRVVRDGQVIDFSIQQQPSRQRILLQKVQLRKNS